MKRGFLVAIESDYEKNDELEVEDLEEMAIAISESIKACGLTNSNVTVYEKTEEQTMDEFLSEVKDDIALVVETTESPDDDDTKNIWK